MAERARVCGGALLVDVSPLGGTRIAATVPRKAAPAATGLPMGWRVAVTAAAAAGCGAVIVMLSAAAPGPTPPSGLTPTAASSTVTLPTIPEPSGSAPPVVQPSAAPPVSSPSPPASPAPAALSCHVKYAKQSEWKEGYVAHITLTNTGTKPIDGWRMTFALGSGQKVTNAWNAIVTQNGKAITAEGTSSTSRIAPDASVMFGFQGTRSGRNPVPPSFVLNGVRCSTPY
jgi:hypothetical protein